MLTLEFLDISVVDTAIGICLFSVLIQIIGIDMKKACHLIHIRKIQANHITINSHLTDIGGHIFNARLFHPLFYLFAVALLKHDSDVIRILTHFRPFPNLRTARIPWQALEVPEPEPPVIS